MVKKLQNGLLYFALACQSFFSIVNSNFHDDNANNLTPQLTAIRLVINMQQFMQDGARPPSLLFCMKCSVHEWHLTVFQEAMGVDRVSLPTAQT